MRQRFAALARGMAGARAGDVTAIHQTRVATRRLREALPLVTSGGAGRKLKRTIRRLTRALGPVRELDVALQTLDQLEKAPDVPRAAVTCLRQLITDERRARHAEAVKAIDNVDLDRMRRKVMEGVAAVDSGTPGGHLPRARRRAARRAERLRTAIDNAAGMYLPERLHDVRIATKKLRYAIEMVRTASAPTRAAAASKSLRSTAGQLALLKRVQDILGHLHDLEVLIARTRAVQATSQAPDLRLSGDLDLLVRHLELECRVLHGHYMAARPQLIEICDRVERHASRAA
jgi:CHAD domain-containing protein